MLLKIFIKKCKKLVNFKLPNHISDIETTKIFVVYQYFLTKYHPSFFFPFCWRNKFLFGQSTKNFSVKLVFEELKKSTQNLVKKIFIDHKILVVWMPHISYKSQNLFHKIILKKPIAGLHFSFKCCIFVLIFCRSDFMVTMYEDLDKQWKILSETCVKAKSIRGYKTNSFKMTANKFQLGIAKPELLEDWDPR